MSAVFLSWYGVSSVVRRSSVTARWSRVVRLWSLSSVCRVMVGWVAPLVIVADGAVDCDSIGSSTARWSHVASGPYGGVSSLATLLRQPSCHGAMGNLFDGHCRRCSFYRTLLIVLWTLLCLCLTFMCSLCALYVLYVCFSCVYSCPRVTSIWMIDCLVWRNSLVPGLSVAIHQDTGYEAMEAVAAEQKYDWGGWRERLRSNRLSTRSFRVRMSKIEGAKAHLAPPPPVPPPLYGSTYGTYLLQFI